MLYNINPNVWGKSFWDVMHFITMAYPDNPTEEDKQNITAFVKTLQFVLPCEKCRAHFKSNLITYPLTNEILSSRYNVILWAVNVHNEVNRRTGKPELIIDDAIKLYSGSNETSEINKKYNYSQIITIVLLIFLIALLIFYIKYK
jgi:Mitochondrial sulfhydryl oxidase involved in the biogenesis of cytosolic Fe/S proteins